MACAGSEPERALRAQRVRMPRKKGHTVGAVKHATGQRKGDRGTLEKSHNFLK